MIKSNFHTGHLPQATICPKHKNFPSWNLLKRPPVVRDHTTCGVRSLWSQYSHHYATQSMRKDLVTIWNYTYRNLEIVCKWILYQN